MYVGMLRCAYSMSYKFYRILRYCQFRKIFFSTQLYGISE